jgi:hypothetical protein
MAASILHLPDKERAAAAEQERTQQSLRLVRMLIDSLPAEAKAELAHELVQQQADRPTGTIAKIIRMAPPGSEITAASLRKAVADHGIEAEPKEIYNSITYLARAGKLRRVGYGRYVVDGVEIKTSEDLGGEKARDEDLADDDR